MCKALSVSTSGYYAWRTRPESKHACEDRGLSSNIVNIFQLSLNYIEGNYNRVRMHSILN